jgi:hypothetical protein
MEFNWFKVPLVMTLYEQGNELLGSAKGGEFLYQLINY